tara:strand:+ start:4453 stop:5664 length:1212 start_codon:yes stop_codon:yes gene_type:complete
MVDTIKEYCENQVEFLERELTDLSLTQNNFSSCSEVNDLKESYKQRLMISVELTDDLQYYINLYIESWFQTSLNRIIELHNRRGKIKENMIELKQLKLPDQRSEEWYAIRENLLTASSLADALGKGHFQTRDGLLISKTSEKSNKISQASRDIMEWGVKYEEVATRLYQHLHNVKVVEFGLIPHPKLSVFGASPDGICDIDSPNGYEGRMLEIKCPPRRKFSKEVPRHYWMQMQGQLEVCDLDECDFLQVKLEEYSNVKEYEEDVFVKDGIQHGYTKQGHPKGSILSYKQDDTIKYIYSPWLASLEQILDWTRNQKSLYPDRQFEQKWWSIERYECTLVRRDKEWWVCTVPEIIKFWSEVVHYRKVGNEEVQKRINGRKRGPRKKIFTIQEPMKGYLIDSDED